MPPSSTASPTTQRLVQVHAIVEKIAGVNGPLLWMKVNAKAIFFSHHFHFSA